MFWGVTILGGRRYTQTVEKSYHISKATLEIPIEGKGKGRVQLMLEQNESSFLLSNFDYEKNVQENLDLIFTEGEEVTFYLKGEGIVHLSGYVLDFDDFDDDFDDEESEDEEVTNKNAKRVLNASLDNAKKAKLEPKEKKAVNGLDEEDDEEDDDVLGALDEEFDSDSDDEEDDEEEDDEEEEDAPIEQKPKPVQKPANGQLAKQQKGTPAKGQLNQKNPASAGKPNINAQKSGQPNQNQKFGQKGQSPQGQKPFNQKGGQQQQKGQFNQNKQQFNKAKGPFTPNQKASNNFSKNKNRKSFA